MILKYLPWDSVFFGFRIARIDVDLNETEIDVRKTIFENESKFDLFYIFGDENLYFKQDDHCKLVDVKLLYAGELNYEMTDFGSVRDYVYYHPSDQLYKLAYTSGKYSRYKLDAKFKNGDFERLYGTWIENSVNKTFADKVLCYYDENDVERGMVTIKFTDGVCRIGLIAVDEVCQSKGIGKKLMAAVKEEMVANNIDSLEVATQKINVIASSFYESCGLSVSEVFNVYHFWCR